MSASSGMDISIRVLRESIRIPGCIFSTIMPSVIIKQGESLSHLKGIHRKKFKAGLEARTGPDTIAANLSCEYLVPLEHSFGIAYRFLRKGDKGDEFLASANESYYPDSSEDAQKQTPTGVSSTQHTFSVISSCFFTPALEADGKLGYSLFLSTRNAYTYFASCSLTLHLR